FAQPAVERPQLLFLADAFAVRRVADEDAGWAIGRLKVAHIAQGKLHQVPDAGRLGIGLRKMQGVAAHIESEDRARQLLADLPPGPGRRAWSTGRHRSPSSP